MNRALLLMLALALLPLEVSAKEPAPPSKEVKAFLKEWSRAMKDVRTLRVRFTQTKKLRFLRRPRVSKGETLLVGKRVLMVVKDAKGKRELELLVAGGEARLHYPRLGRVEVLSLKGSKPPPTPFPLFGQDLERLPKAYALTFERDARGKVLVLVPRAAGSAIKQTRMRFKGTEVSEVVQVGKKGNRMTLVVEAFVKNPAIDARQLKLTTTKDTKVVRVRPRRPAPKPSRGSPGR